MQQQKESGHDKIIHLCVVELSINYDTLRCTDNNTQNMWECKV